MFGRTTTFPTTGKTVTKTGVFIRRTMFTLNGKPEIEGEKTLVLHNKRDTLVEKVVDFHKRRIMIVDFHKRRIMIY